MQVSDRDRLIAKIKKCLALSRSSNANEAATALRQAQALMSQHGVTLDDVEGAGVEEAMMKTRETKNAGTYLMALMQLVCKAFGVRAAINTGYSTCRVYYIGPRGRVELAVYAHTVIDRAVRNGWEQARHSFRGLSARGARLGYRLGFLRSVESQVQALAPTEAEERAMQRHLNGTTKAVKVRGSAEIDMRAAMMGLRDGEGLSLSVPVSQQVKALSHE